MTFLARRLGARVIFAVHEVQDTGEAKIPLASRYVGLVWRLLNPLVDAFVMHRSSTGRSSASGFVPASARWR